MNSEQWELNCSLEFNRGKVTADMNKVNGCFPFGITFYSHRAVVFTQENLNDFEAFWLVKLRNTFIKILV